MAVANKVKGFFGDVAGKQGDDSPTLLPTKVKDGAPAGNLWLMHFVEGEVEIRYTKMDDHPYLSYRAAIDEPEDYAGRNVFGMFFFPRTPADTDDSDAQEKYKEQLERVVGQVDAVLGEGTCRSLGTDTLEASLQELVPMLDNVGFVGKIGLERGKKRDSADTDKEAERYPDRNRISRFAAADTWES